MLLGSVLGRIRAGYKLIVYLTLRVSIVDQLGERSLLLSSVFGLGSGQRPFLTRKHTQELRATFVIAHDSTS